jgi:hypothetical protein
MNLSLRWIAVIGYMQWNHFFTFTKSQQQLPVHHSHKISLSLSLSLSLSNLLLLMIDDVVVYFVWISNLRLLFIVVWICVFAVWIWPKKSAYEAHDDVVVVLFRSNFFWWIKHHKKQRSCLWWGWDKHTKLKKKRNEVGYNLNKHKFINLNNLININLNKIYIFLK